MGRYRIVIRWDDMPETSEYVVEVVGVECQSLVGHYSVVSPFSQGGKLTKCTGYFPIRWIEKMEKIT